MDKFEQGQQGRLEKSICFDCSKREIFTPSQGLKALRRKLQSAYKISACAEARRPSRDHPVAVISLLAPHHCRPPPQTRRRSSHAPPSPCHTRPNSGRRNKDTITLERLRESSLVVFLGPRERFSSAEVLPRCPPSEP